MQKKPHAQLGVEKLLQMLQTHSNVLHDFN